MITPEKVLALLSSRWFEKWYDEDFISYISGDEGAPSEEEILKFLKDRLES